MPRTNPQHASDQTTQRQPEVSYCGACGAANIQPGSIWDDGCAKCTPMADDLEA